MWTWVDERNERPSDSSQHDFSVLKFSGPTTSYCSSPAVSEILILLHAVVTREETVDLTRQNENRTRDT